MVDGPDDAPDASAQSVRVTAWVSGQVQGVGFRWWVRTAATDLGLVGAATNLDDGRVEVVAQGSRTACEALLARLNSRGTPGHVRSVTHRWSDPRPDEAGFRLG